MGAHSEGRTDRVVAQARLARQHVTKAVTDSVAGMVRRLVAVQAQDFAGAKWALDTAPLRRTTDAIVAALEGGRHLTRQALRQVLERAGVSAGRARCHHE
jgi:hypothetical protein